MSISYRLLNCDTEELTEFLESEYSVGSSIPVHLFSVVNATISAYNRSLGITDGAGTLFFEGPRLLKGYGYNNQPNEMLTALTRCAVKWKVSEW